MEFKPRLTAPTKDNKYYYKDNIFYKCGYGMPNCTCYAYGRAYEQLGRDPKLCTANAENWFDYVDGYNHTQTPRLGDIVVWASGRTHYGKDGAGHVAVVEHIAANGDIQCSNSAYNGKNFYLTTHTKASGYKKGNYKLLGFIHLVDYDEPPYYVPGKYKLLVAKCIRNNHSISNNIVKVGETRVDIRKDLTSTKSKDNAKFKVGTIVEITEVFTEHNGRIWGKLRNSWIVLCNADGTPQAKKI